MIKVWENVVEEPRRPKFRREDGGHSEPDHYQKDNTSHNILHL
jgi:hypothetical protein